MANIFRQAYELVITKTCEEMTEEEQKLVAITTSFVANELARIEPKRDEELVSLGLLKLARIIEEDR